MSAHPVTHWALVASHWQPMALEHVRLVVEPEQPRAQPPLGSTLHCVSAAQSAELLYRQSLKQPGVEDRAVYEHCGSAAHAVESVYR
jgi:hypothetical protein